MSLRAGGGFHEEKSHVLGELAGRMARTGIEAREGGRGRRGQWITKLFTKSPLSSLSASSLLSFRWLL